MAFLYGHSPYSHWVQSKSFSTIGLAFRKLMWVMKISRWPACGQPLALVFETCRWELVFDSTTINARNGLRLPYSDKASMVVKDPLDRERIKKGEMSKNSAFKARHGMLRRFDSRCEAGASHGGASFEGRGADRVPLRDARKLLRGLLEKQRLCQEGCGEQGPVDRGQVGGEREELSTLRAHSLHRKLNEIEFLG